MYLEMQRSPVLKPETVLHLKQVAGNKAVRSLLDQRRNKERGFPPQNGTSDFRDSRNGWSKTHRIQATRIAPRNRSQERIIPREVIRARKYFKKLESQKEKLGQDGALNKAKGYEQRRVSRVTNKKRQKRIAKSIQFAYRETFGSPTFAGKRWATGKTGHLGKGEAFTGLLSSGMNVGSAAGIVKTAVGGFGAKGLKKFGQAFANLLKHSKSLYGIAKDFATDPGKFLKWGDLLKALQSLGSGVKGGAQAAKTVISGIVGSAITILSGLLLLPDKIKGVYNRTKRTWALWVAGRKRVQEKPWKKYAKYGRGKVLRSLLLKMGELLKSLADIIMSTGSIVTMFLFPPASVVISIVQTVGNFLALSVSIASKVRGMIKFLQGKRGKLRYEAAEAFVTAAQEGDEEAAQLIKRLDPYGTATDKIMDYLKFWDKKLRRKFRKMLKGSPSEVCRALMWLNPKERKAFTEELADRLKST